MWVTQCDRRVFFEEGVLEMEVLQRVTWTYQVVEWEKLVYGKRTGRYVRAENAVRTGRDVVWELGAPLG